MKRNEQPPSPFRASSRRTTKIQFLRTWNRGVVILNFVRSEHEVGRSELPTEFLKGRIITEAYGGDTPGAIAGDIAVRKSGQRRVDRRTTTSGKADLSVCTTNLEVLVSLSLTRNPCVQTTSAVVSTVAHAPHSMAVYNAAMHYHVIYQHELHVTVTSLSVTALLLTRHYHVTEMPFHATIIIQPLNPNPI